MKILIHESGIYRVNIDYVHFLRLIFAFTIL